MDLALIDLIGPATGGGASVLSIWLYMKVKELESDVKEIKTDNSKKLDSIFKETKNISGMISENQLLTNDRIAEVEKDVAVLMDNR